MHVLLAIWLGVMNFLKPEEHSRRRNAVRRRMLSGRLHRHQKRNQRPTSHAMTLLGVDASGHPPGPDRQFSDIFGGGTHSGGAEFAIDIGGAEALYKEVMSAVLAFIRPVDNYVAETSACMAMTAHDLRPAAIPLRL